VARAVGADLVVVGRRGALRRVLGSVSADVVRRAPCDVLVVG
jgi:nucleotide-binding universal stress UspA family protein